MQKTQPGGKKHAFFALSNCLVLQPWKSPGHQDRTCPMEDWRPPRHVPDSQHSVHSCVVRDKNTCFNMWKKREFFTKSLPWSTFPQVTENHSSIQRIPEEVDALMDIESDTDIMEDANLPNNERMHEVQVATGCGGESYGDLSRPVSLLEATEEDNTVSLKKGSKEKVSRKKSPTTDKTVGEKDGGSCKWTEKSLKVLVDAKLQELKRLMDKSDTKFHMLKAHMKWQLISDHLHGQGLSYSWKQCRDKWGAELTVYKRLSDFQNMSGREDYFTMGAEERKSYGLPADYSAEQFELLGTVLKDRANINPPGIGDSGIPRKKKSVNSKSTPSSGTGSGKKKNSSGSDKDSSDDEFNTRCMRKTTSEKKRKVSSANDDAGIEVVLDKFGDKFCDKMGGLFTSVMGNAADKQQVNVKELVAAGHEDVKELTGMLAQFLQK